MRVQHTRKILGCALRMELNAPFPVQLTDDLPTAVTMRINSAVLRSPSYDSNQSTENLSPGVSPTHDMFVTDMAAARKHRACNRPGRPFCDKACNRIGGIATNPPCDKPIEDCSTLHGGLRQGFVTRDPRQRFVTGGTATNLCFEPHRYHLWHLQPKCKTSLWLTVAGRSVNGFGMGFQQLVRHELVGAG